jgi:hypothetical protein
MAECLDGTTYSKIVLSIDRNMYNLLHRVVVTEVNIIKNLDI